MPAEIVPCGPRGGRGLSGPLRSASLLVPLLHLVGIPQGETVQLRGRFWGAPTACVASECAAGGPGVFGALGGCPELSSGVLIDDAGIHAPTLRVLAESLFDHRDELLQCPLLCFRRTQGECLGNFAIEDDCVAVLHSGDRLPCGVVGDLGRGDVDREGNDQVSVQQPQLLIGQVDAPLAFFLEVFDGRD